MYTAMWLVGAAVLSGPAPQAEAVRSYAWYRFEDAGDLTRNVGTHPLPAWLPEHGVAPIDGRIGRGLLLDGLRSHGLKIPNPYRLFGREATTGTIMLWVKPSFDVASDKREQVLFDFTPRTGNTRVDGYEIVAVMTGSKFRVQPQLGCVMRLATPLTKGTWTHLALAWDAAQGAAFYVNGKRVAGLKRKFKPVKLGRFAGWIGHHGTCGRPFDGAVDEVRLFNRMLSDEEVAALVELDPKPSLDVTAWHTHGPEVVNRGEQVAQAWVRVFQSEQPHLVAGPARTIAPGGRARLRLPKLTPTLRSRRLGAMAGIGNAAHECAARDYTGLVLRLDPPKRVFFHDERPVLGLAVTNDLPDAFTGRLDATIADWDGKALRTVPAVQASAKRGETVRVRWASGKPLPIGAYRLTVEGELPGARRQTLMQVNLISTKRERYRDIFGVATTFHKKTDDVWQRAKADGVTVLRAGAGYTPDMRYHEELTDRLGRFGLKNYANLNPIRACPVDRSLPGVKGTGRYACLSHPKALEAIRTMARGVAQYYQYNAVTPTVFVEGELPYHPPDYSELSTRAFRDWLRKRYASLDALNKAWHKKYKTWDAIEQIGSRRDVDAAAHSKQWMKLKLPKRMADRFQALAKLDRTRAIEWRRWHQSVIDHAYRVFVDEFRKHNTVTGIGTNPCWPNFHPHILFFWGGLFTVAGLDPYLPGTLPQDLGYPSELLESIDMTASIYQGKPLWTNEVYDLSTYPAGVPEAQGWCLVGHGYSLPTYFTYDYYYEGQRGGKPLEFGLFDKQGKPYATYPSFQRFCRDVHAFHAKYDAHSLRRERPRVAMFLSDANGTAGWLETGGRTWNATAVLSHIGAHWLTRQAGYPVEFINEDLWSRAGGMQVLIVPWTDLVPQKELERVLTFARRGGTVILDGPVGTYDELWRGVTPQPGGQALASLSVTWDKWTREKNEMVLSAGVAKLGLEPGTRIPCLGKPAGVKTGKATVLAADAQGTPMVVRTPLGKGQVYCLLANLGLRQRVNQPDAGALALWQAMLGSAGMQAHALLTGPNPLKAGVKPTARDVTLRIKGDDTLFVFVVSFLGPTKGTLHLRLPLGQYQATEARTGKPVALQAVASAWELPIDLPAFGTGVYMIRSTKPGVFATW